MFEAVISDWDGTLANSTSFVVESFKQVLREVGCEIDDDFIARRMGIGPRNTLEEALQLAGIKYDKDFIDELEKRKIGLQLRQTYAVTLYDGAKDLLSELHGKVKIALATMSNRRVIDKLLKEKEILRYFDLIVTFDEIQRPKPDPEVFLMCSTKIDCPPEKCVVIEDSVFGVRAAKAAKMNCIAVSSGAYSLSELRRERPDLLVNSLEKKEEILRFIFSSIDFKI